MEAAAGTGGPEQHELVELVDFCCFPADGAALCCILGRLLGKGWEYFLKPGL